MQSYCLWHMVYITLPTSMKLNCRLALSLTKDANSDNGHEYTTTVRHELQKFVLTCSPSQTVFT